jgi:predicted permease
MSAVPPSVRALLGAHALLVRALPAGFRHRNAAELSETAREAVLAALAARGPAAACRRAGHELLDLGAVVLRLHAPRVPAAGGHAVVLPRPDGDPPMVGLLHDLRRATRALLRRPGYALAGMATLALGVGAAIAVGSVAHTVLVRALPFPDADRVMMVWRTAPKLGMDRGPTSVADLLDFQRQARSFTDLAAYTSGATGTLLAGRTPQPIEGARVSGNLFRTLGVPTALGRAILDADGEPGAEPTIVLSDALWRRAFGGDTAIVGRSVDMGEQRVRVVGVMPHGFAFPSSRTEFWSALPLDPAESSRDENFLTAIGRVRPGVSPDAAQAELAAISARILAANPADGNDGAGVRLERRQDFVTRNVRPVLVMLLGGALLLLGIACANLANLMLVRTTARTRELAIRAALGAGRARLLRDLTAEGAVLAVGGGLLGVGLAWGAIRALLVLGPAALPRREEIGLDAPTLAIAAALSVGCALLCALIPAWRATRRPTGGGTLRDGSRATEGRATSRLQDGLVVVQLALALVLFVAAGLLGHSLWRLMEVPTGFDARPVLTARISLPQSRYTGPAQVHAFYDALFDRLATLPGVAAVGGTWALPFAGTYGSSRRLPTDGTWSWDDAASVDLAPVRGDYFAALGMRIVQGTGFTGQERVGQPAVTVVNETLARRYWPGQNPVGRQLRGRDADDLPVTVIGVVSDVKRRALDAETGPEMYLAHGQTPWAGGDLYVTVRASADPVGLAPALRAAVSALDPRLAVTGLAPLEDLIDESVAAPRFRTVVVAALAAIAGALALVGVYGVLAFVVSMRTREMAVRVALGATRRQMLGGVLGRGLRLTGLGVALGLAGALGSGRLLGSLLYGLTPLDAPTYAAMCALLIAAALLACWVPARRAANVDPVVALREE